MPHPDLLLNGNKAHAASGTYHGGECGSEERAEARRQGIDRKLARKIRQKKIAQGHAVDDHENMVQTQ